MNSENNLNQNKMNQTKAPEMKDRLAESGVNQEMLDLLTDGELSLKEQRELIARLENAPDGWKRCALTFLESQALKQEFSDFDELFAPEMFASEKKSVAKSDVSESDVKAASLLDSNKTFLSENPLKENPSENSMDVVTTAVGPPKHSLMSWGLGLAASVLVGFSLGMFVSPAKQSTDLVPKNQLAGTQVETSTEGKSPTINPKLGNPKLGNPDSVTYVGDLTLTNQSNANQQFQVPILDGPGAEASVRARRSTMPEHAREMLEKAGHRVQHRQQLVPIQLKDGRVILLPVEQVEIRPSGMQDYQ